MYDITAVVFRLHYRNPSFMTNRRRGSYAANQSTASLCNMTTDFLNYSKWLKVRMDEGNTKCEENARYSFLLGSALRNEDTEQFLQIYDAILPTEISPELVSFECFRTPNIGYGW